MEDVLEVYHRPHDPDYPLVCVDESSKQLIKETRTAIPMKSGRPARYDYEYERNGTANLFMMFAPLFVIPGKVGGPGYKAQNNTQSIITDPDTISRFSAELVAEHMIAQKQNAAANPKQGAIAKK